MPLPAKHAGSTADSQVELCIFLCILYLGSIVFVNIEAVVDLEEFQIIIFKPNQLGSVLVIL